MFNVNCTEFMLRDFYVIWEVTKLTIGSFCDFEVLQLAKRSKNQTLLLRQHQRFEITKLTYPLFSFATLNSKTIFFKHGGNFRNEPTFHLFGKIYLKK